ncbi:MAG: hypothetical protein OXR66_08960 [Candidatus Woesearchaeota archaeon]|nr:hypothetical protein [Candidatus Woesearchaeota archaeon]
MTYSHTLGVYHLVRDVPQCEHSSLVLDPPTATTSARFLEELPQQRPKQLETVHVDVRPKGRQPTALIRKHL